MLFAQEKKRKEKKGGPYLALLHSMTRLLIGCMGNSSPNIGCHYFAELMIALLKNTLAIKLLPRNGIGKYLPTRFSVQQRMGKNNEKNKNTNIWHAHSRQAGRQAGRQTSLQ
jgi:hypothetical protein